MIRILWLDDDFQAITETTSNDIKEKRERLHRALSDASLFGFEIDAVPFYDVFLEKINHYQQYQVVILDLKGLDRYDSSNNRVFPEAQRKIKDLPLSVYVYSGTRNDDPRLDFYLEEFEKNGGVIVSKNEDIPTFFQRIKTDYEKNAFRRYYRGHEYCRDLISERFLDSSDQILDAMNDIMKHYHERDILYAPYNKMRTVMENMLAQLASIGEITLESTPTESNKRFKDRLNYISRDCHINSKTQKPIFNNHIYPFSKCPPEIRIVLRFLGDITNDWRHYIEDHSDYLRKGELSAEYNGYIQSASYEAFLVIMRWYFALRSSFNEKERSRQKAQLE